MRTEFIEKLGQIAENDEGVVLLTGDLGFTVLEDFAQRFPSRFYNVGVAEQNMVGLATGLAEAGFTPFVYSIATFATMRPYEFIRNGPALHELPVRIVGVGGGLDYGHNGITHYALEDVGLMRLQPGMTTIAPGDAHQAVAALASTWQLPRPIYYRLGKQPNTIDSLNGRFQLGRFELLRDGDAIAIVGLGPAITAGLDAADLLADRGVDAAIALVTSFNPSPLDDLRTLLADVPAVLTVEAHYVTGGLGSLVAEVIAEEGLDCRLLRCGIDDMPRASVGSQSYLQDLHELDARSIARSALEMLAPAHS